MNQLDKVRGAVVAYDKAEQVRAYAAEALKNAEHGLTGAGKELVRVLDCTVPGRSVILGGRRYTSRDGGLDVVACDDVVL